MTPLVLLPGMMCDERLFAPQISELSKQREVHFVQISGHKTISELAADVLNNAPPVFAVKRSTPSKKTRHQPAHLAWNDYVRFAFRFAIKAGPAHARLGTTPWPE